MGSFVIRRVKTGIKFDLKAANGQVILTSEVYSSEAACRRGLESVRRSAPSAGILDLTLPGHDPAANPRFEIYSDKSGSHRFRLKARNGKIIAVSEAYAGKANCLKGIESIRANAPAAEIIYEKEIPHGYQGKDRGDREEADLRQESDDKV